MPWKETRVVDERMRFVMEYQLGHCSKSELCQKYGVSRPTGDLWIARFEQRGVAGLEDLSRAPHRHPNQMAPEIERVIVELRRAHPRWGPKKLRAKLVAQRPHTRWPALSTMGELLKREGLAVARKRRRTTPPYTEPFVGVDAPNQVWCMDFKGWFHTRDGDRIDPFTLTDAHSRYLLRCQAVERSSTEPVWGVLDACLREWGLPLAIRSDNGSPFAARGLAGLSRVAVRLLKLGIRPERIQAGHPEQNGRHERMHRTLKEETTNPPAAHRRAQQQAFDRFRQQYNEQRPHEALGQKTPAECYCASPRAYPAHLSEPEYETGTLVRRIGPNGFLNWKTQEVFLSKALAGEAIGLEALDDRYYRIRFGHFSLARFDSYKRRVESWSNTEPATEKHRNGTRWK